MEKRVEERREMKMGGAVESESRPAGDRGGKVDDGVVEEEGDGKSEEGEEQAYLTKA